MNGHNKRMRLEGQKGPQHLELLPALLGAYLGIDQCVEQLRGNEHIPEVVVVDAVERNSSDFALPSSCYDLGALQAVVVLMDMRHLMCARTMNSWMLSNIKIQRTGSMLPVKCHGRLPASDLERYADGSTETIEPLVEPELRFEEVTADRWDDFETLLSSKGGPKNCWCMAWRALPSRSRGDNAAMKQAMMDRILDEQPVGLLGYRGTEPVSWCSVAPRASFRPLGGLGDDETKVWSLVCMFLKREIRGVGLGKELIRAAVEHSRLRGADILEASPVDPESPSYRFMGFVPAFNQLCFKEVRRAGSRRHVMRLDLR